jgi:hypothetical protein
MAGTQNDKPYHQLVQSLLLGMVGALHFHQSFTMMVFPAQAKEWDFLDLVASGREAKLKFIIHANLNNFNPLLHLPSLPVSFRETNVTPIVTLFREVLDVSVDSLFTSSSGAEMDRNVFLMIPPCYSDEIKLWKEFFAKSSTKVYSTWQKFLRLYKVPQSGIVIVGLIQSSGASDS